MVLNKVEKPTLFQDGSEQSHSVRDRAARPADYCAKLLRVHDGDRFYGLRYAAQPMRDHLIAIYAWQVELRHIIQQVSAPPLGEIRLQWWRDAFAEIVAGGVVRSHPVVQAMATVMMVAGENTHLTKAVECAITARARLLYDAPFTDCDDLYTWLMEAEGALARAAAQMSGALPDMADHVERVAVLVMMVRDGQRLAPGLDPSVLKQSVRVRWNDLRKILSPVAPVMMPLCLPASLIPLYAKQKTNRPVALRRHLVYLRSVLTGRL